MIEDMVGEVLLLISLKIANGKKLDVYNLDPTLNWNKAEITEINENYLILNQKRILILELINLV